MHDHVHTPTPTPAHTLTHTRPPPHTPTALQELEEASAQDIEELQAALEEANERIAHLEAQQSQLQGAHEQASKWVRRPRLARRRCCCTLGCTEALARCPPPARALVAAAPCGAARSQTKLRASLPAAQGRALAG